MIKRLYVEAIPIKSSVQDGWDVIPQQGMFTLILYAQFKDANSSNCIIKKSRDMDVNWSLVLV